MNYFIPNYIVQGNEDNPTTIKSMFANNIITENDVDKVLQVFMYLHSYTTNSGCIRFNLNDLIEKCGFSPRTGKGQNNEKFKMILNYLNENGYFEPNEYKFMEIKPNQFVEVVPQYFHTDSEGKWKSYVILSEGEKKTIENLKNVDGNKILLVYSSLKSRINSKSNVCYPSAEDIAKDILLSEDVIYRYINQLKEIDIIYYDNAGIFYKTISGERKYSPANNTYTLPSIENYKGYVEQSIEEYVSYMNVLGWKRTKKVKLDSRQLSGTINRLTHLKETKGLTKKQEKALQDAINKKDLLKGEDRIKFENKELLEKNEGKILSEIFTDMYMETNAEKYYNIELNLELINKDQDLLVDWDYYKHTMINYEEDKHQYYYNCVQKKKKESRGKGSFGNKQKNITAEGGTSNSSEHVEISYNSITNSDENVNNFSFHQKNKSIEDIWGTPNPMKYPVINHDVNVDEYEDIDFEKKVENVIDNLYECNDNNNVVMLGGKSKYSDGVDIDDILSPSSDVEGKQKIIINDIELEIENDEEFVDTLFAEEKVVKINKAKISDFEIKVQKYQIDDLVKTYGESVVKEVLEYPSCKGDVFDDLDSISQRKIIEGTIEENIEELLFG